MPCPVPPCQRCLFASVCLPGTTPPANWEPRNKRICAAFLSPDVFQVPALCHIALHIAAGSCQPVFSSSSRVTRADRHAFNGGRNSERAHVEKDRTFQTGRPGPTYVSDTSSSLGDVLAFWMSGNVAPVNDMSIIVHNTSVAGSKRAAYKSSNTTQQTYVAATFLASTMALLSRFFILVALAASSSALYTG